MEKTDPDLRPVSRHREIETGSCMKAKWLLLTSAVATAVSILFLALGAAGVFGSLGSVGSIASISGGAGGLAVVLAAAFVGVVVIRCKSRASHKFKRRAQRERQPEGMAERTKSRGKSISLLFSVKISLEEVKALLGEGIDINTSDRMGCTLLYYASMQEDPTVLNFLLAQEGINISAENGPEKETVLHYAVLYDKKELVNLLLKAGADVNAQNRTGETPLYKAVISDNEALARSLIDQKDININLPDRFGNTPLHKAAGTRRFDMMQLLIGNATATVRNNKGETPLHWAAKCVFPKGVALLLDHGATVGELDAQGENSLHHLAREAHHHLEGPFSETIRLFTQKDASLLSMKNKEGERPVALLEATLGPELCHVREKLTPLDWQLFSPTSIDAFLGEGGVHINAKNSDQCTPLYLAARGAKEDPTTFLYLLTCPGVDLDAQNGLDQNTVLHFAVRWSLEEVIDALLRQGANVNAKNREGKTPLHFAVWDCSEKIVASLIQQKGIEIDSHDQFGNTPLHLAAVRRHLSAMRLLIDGNAGVSARNRVEETPLLVAAKNMFSEGVKLLLKSGAKVDEHDEEYRNALHLVASENHNFEDRVSVLRTINILKNQNADLLNRTDSAGNRPMDLLSIHPDLGDVRDMFEPSV